MGHGYLVPLELLRYSLYQFVFTSNTGYVMSFSLILLGCVQISAPLEDAAFVVYMVQFRTYYPVGSSDSDIQLGRN